MSSSSNATAANGIEALNALVTSTLDLITRLETVVASLSAENARDNTTTSTTTTNSEEESNAHPEINPLSLASDASSLIRAHCTKLSLLIINEPFTPSAISSILRQLTSGPLPGLASAAQICAHPSSPWTATISADLGYRISRVLRETRSLVEKVPKDGKALKEPPAGKGQRAGARGTGKQGSVVNTGMLWAACDEVVGFAKRGFGGNLVRKCEEMRDTVRDVAEELKEWGEETGSDEEDEEDEDDDEDEEEDDGEEDKDVKDVTQSLEAAKIADTQAMLDDLMNSSNNYIPRDDPDKIRERLESCLRRLRLVTLLYTAVAKRRFKSLPAQPVQPTESKSDIPKRLDEIMVLLKKIPERFGSLALAFYELDPVEIDRLMDQCFFDCFAVAELLIKPWDGEKDEFSEWLVKFQAEIKKA